MTPDHPGTPTEQDYDWDITGLTDEELMVWHNQLALALEITREELTHRLSEAT